MSLNFADSLKQNDLNNTKFRNISSNNINNGISTMSLEDDSNIAVATVATEEPTVMAFSLDDASTFADLSNWTAIRDKGYRFYNNEYNDEKYSSVDELKNIILDPSQFNITQEENSQYIPFQMPRYYDGFDLAKTELSIYYLNKNKDSHSDIPVDVYYNDEYIRFAWLVSEFATQVAGILQFEIHAKGINSKGESYTWKSKSIDKLNVLQSLEDITVGEIGISEEEIAGWYNKIQLETQRAQEYASSASASASEAARLVSELNDGIVDEVKNAVDNTVGSVVDEKITEQLENYYTIAETYDRDTIDSKIDAVKPEGYATIEYVNGQINDVEEYVDEQIKSIDVTEQLNDYALKTDIISMIASNPQDFATKQDVADAIEAEDITTKLDNYYTKDQTYNQTEIDEKLGNVSVDLTGYATETYVDNKTSILNAGIESNKTNISSISTIVSELQSEVNSIDKSPRLTYDVAYNDMEDPDVGENVFVLYEIENEGVEGEEKREAKKKFTIVGGSGGGSGSVLKIEYIEGYKSPIVVTVNDKAIIKYKFSGTDSSGDEVTEGVATWKVAGRVVATNTAISGENEFDVTQYLSIGSQKVSLSITDEGGSLATKTWTLQKIDVRIESTFNDKLTYPIESISFDYTPYGAISKDVHFKLDGKDIGKVTTTSSGIPMAYELPVQEHGSHLLEVYMTATINNNLIESNHITKDIAWYDSSSTIPVITSVYQNFTARQHDTTNIEYTVNDPTTETPTVSIAVNGVVVSTPTLTSSSAIYPFKATEAGTYTITITCGETIKTLTANIEELDIDVSPVTAGLVFDFNPVGKSNNDADRVWTDGTYSMSVSDNFDWTNGGYQIDENGDQYFCIKAGTFAEIDYQLFADD